MLRLIATIILLFFLHTLNAQVIIKGFVLDSLGKKLEGANIYLLDKGNIKKTTISDTAGSYIIEINDTLPRSFQIIVSLWGYKTERKELLLTKSTTFFNITLHSEVDLIEAIEIKPQEYDIQQIGDTTIYKIQQFSDSTEQNVEDLLGKIPGVKVDENGKISFKGKSVEKVFVEGDDLFGNNYTIGTRSLSGKVIDEAQFIDNFSENALLKELENSDKLVLNLTLKKSRNLFGNLDISVGYKNRRDLQGNFFYVANKLKAINLFKHLNTGQEIITNLQDNATQEGGQLFLSPNYTTNTAIIYPNFFKKQRFNENKPFLNTSYWIYKPNEKTKIQVGLGYYRDTQKQLYKDDYLFKLSAENLKITNEQNYRLSRQDLGANVLYSQKINLHSAFNARFTFSKNQLNGQNGIFFNSNDLLDTIRQNTKPENISWRGDLDYTYKISPKTAYSLVLNAENHTNKEAADYVNTIPRYVFLDSTLSANTLRQLIGRNDLNLSQKSTFYYKISPKNSLQSSLVVHSKQVKFANEYTLSKNLESRIFQKPFTTLTHQEIQGILLYNQQIKKIDVQTQLKIYSSSIKIDTLQNPFMQSRNILSPSIFFKTNLKDKNLIGIGYEYGFTNMQLDNFYPIERFKSYNFAEKGTTRVDWLPKHNINARYSYLSLYDQLFFNVLLDYQYTPKNYSDAVSINPLFLSSEKRLLGKTQNFLLNTSIDYYIDALKGKIEANATTIFREYPNILLNEERFNKLIFFKNNISYASKFTGKTNFKLNFTQFRTKIITEQDIASQNIKNNIYEVRKELYIKLTENITLNFITDYFYTANNHIFMNDISIKAKIGKKRNLLEFICNNLNLQPQLKLVTINDYQVYTQFFNFLPTYCLIRTNINLL
ncbi:MAG: hypothetical protein Fur0027_20320 [Raineya sp.]